MRDFIARAAAVISVSAFACTTSSTGGDAGSSDASVEDAAPNDALPDTPASLTWFTTCGDPVCGAPDAGHRSHPGVSVCTTETIGQPCANEGAECDPGDSCNALYVCARIDPKTGPGGCPISRASAKTSITYLDDAAREGIAREVRAMRLATYAYKGDPNGKRHLGFIIDDDPESPAVDDVRDRIELYAYTSMLVAALQSQEMRLAQDEKQIRQLQRELDDLQAAKQCRASP